MIPILVKCVLSTSYALVLFVSLLFLWVIGNIDDKDTKNELYFRIGRLIVFAMFIIIAVSQVYGFLNVWRML